jgi:hypothetical protein
MCTRNATSMERERGACPQSRSPIHRRTFAPPSKAPVCPQIATRNTTLASRSRTARRPRPPGPSRIRSPDPRSRTSRASRPSRRALRIARRHAHLSGSDLVDHVTRDCPQHSRTSQATTSGGRATGRLTSLAAYRLHAAAVPAPPHSRDDRPDMRGPAALNGTAVGLFKAHVSRTSCAGQWRWRRG